MFTAPVLHMSSLINFSGGVFSKVNNITLSVEIHCIVQYKCEEYIWTAAFLYSFVDACTASNCQTCTAALTACDACPTAYTMVDTDFDNVTESCEGERVVTTSYKMYIKLQWI
jgi:hypothetical protein